MPGTKSARRGTRSRPRRPKPKTSPLLKTVGMVAVLAALVLAGLLAARLLAPPASRLLPVERPKPLQPTQLPATTQRPGAKAPEAKTSVAARSAGSETAPDIKPQPEPAPVAPTRPEPDTADSNSLHAALPPLPPERPPLKKPPRVAIIIDDVGYDRSMAEKFMGLNAALTLAILPHTPHQQTIARIAHAQGVEIMLHLPMEPVEYPEINPGPGTLLSSMSPDELLQALEENLQAVPYIKGVNNHMGSKLTTRSEQVYQVFSVLKRHGFFFVDSRTTEASVCKPSARMLQIPFAQRDVFLDHVQEPAFIRKQIRELVRIAKHKGEALGIAHPYPATYTILREELPALRQQVDLVPVSQLVRIVG
jgi:hypothetical protein